jgi:hypothetical protein
MLEELEESLDEISKTGQCSDPSPNVAKEESELSWLERHFDFIKPSR